MRARKETRRERRERVAGTGMPCQRSTFQISRSGTKSMEVIAMERDTERKSQAQTLKSSLVEEGGGEDPVKVIRVGV